MRKRSKISAHQNAQVFAGQQWRHRHREQTCEHSAGSRGWDDLREEHGDTYLTICKYVNTPYVNSQWEFAVDTGSSTQCPVTAERGGVGGTREGSSGGKEHRYAYGQFMLMYGRGQYNIARQLSSDEKEKNKIKCPSGGPPFFMDKKERSLQPWSRCVAKPGQHPQKTSFSKGTKRGMKTRYTAMVRVQGQGLYELTRTHLWICPCWAGSQIWLKIRIT